MHGSKHVKLHKYCIGNNEICDFLNHKKGNSQLWALNMEQSFAKTYKLIPQPYNLVLLFYGIHCFQFYFFLDE